jgi:Putative zinc-finger
MCIPEGTLRAKLDGELSGAELAQVETHMASCERCRERLRAIASRAGRAGALLSDLGTGEPVDTRLAWARLERDLAAEPPRRRRWMPRLTPAWGATAAAAVAALLLASPPGRAVGQKLLGMLRVKAVVAVPMERDFIAEGKGEMLQQLMADSVVKTKESRRLEVSGREEAARLAGMSVRLPELRTDAPQLFVNTESAARFTVNEQRLETLLAVAGRSDLQFPADLNGAQVFVSVPANVLARYGNCPAENQHERTQGPYDDCVVVSQVPVPTVVTQPELDLSGVAEFGLQLTGMTPEQAHLFSQTVDWTSTIAVPIPRNAASFETVTVDGVKGLMVVGLPDRQLVVQVGGRSAPKRVIKLPPAYGLLWVHNGVMYSVAGYGDPALAQPLAESLR